MKNTFVETANVRRFHTALTALERRGEIGRAHV